MAKEQKRFLKIVRQAWAAEFPFLEPVDLAEVPRLDKGSNFRCDRYFDARGVCYFLQFHFLKSRHGEFSLRVAVSPSPDKSVLSFGPYRDPGPTTVGYYNIADFLVVQSFTWAIVDVNAKLDELWLSLGVEPLEHFERKPAVFWKPSSFALPFEEICAEAIGDINDKLRCAVFPKLQIALPR